MEKQTQNRLQTFSSQTIFSLFCCVCKSTNLNEKEIREICVEMLSRDIKHTDYILNIVLLWKGL